MNRKQKKRLRNYGLATGVPVLALYYLQQLEPTKRDVTLDVFGDHFVCWDELVWSFEFPTFYEFSAMGIETQKAINITQRMRHELVEFADFRQAVDKLPPWERDEVMAGHLELNVPSGKTYQN